ncbi:uncharacterized protein (TIGR00375 family) [Desulfobaculum xiamenense]|uniref:Uncharacterized protein (TIGR00375 family) n=1 Tax=Desulfobaculum xiamenense TaxID=995050 RepID=A0A846QS36_9BACT|nr:uncharacterized protein (TIGR00375 family) [Desulfobaculum xiamenense]
MNLRSLSAWARVKGLDVLATGDFTHPAWMAEIEDMLEQDDSGLLTLRDPRRLEREIPLLEGYPLSGRVRFMLCTEISSIYKRGGRVRKNHNLVFMPTLDMAKSFTRRLAQVGNLESDGRPILGLDARDLLEMVLETGPNAFLVPAHIWTPWFSLFGSKSGFDSVEECFGDLSSEIFAMETGLSSDPDMNRMWSALDRYRMISNSDAHSGEKLAREANLFSGEMSYEGIYRALRGEALGHRFLGTLEFFPEEGKYHLDGHRACGVVMDPQETRARGGLCPVCGKPLTVGVLNRVMELADRETPLQPSGQPGFSSLVPLPEIVGEVLGVGPSSKKVQAFYGRLIARFGSELAVLQEVPLEDIAHVSTPLAEGIARMRRGQVLRQPGFDGQYGVITVFSPAERDEIRRGGSLITMPAPRAPRAVPVPRADAAVSDDASPKRETAGQGKTSGVGYNAAQKRAIAAGPGPVLVLAGPGTGKTQTLMGRIDALLDAGENPRHILALTFTRRAAAEMRRRLVDMRGEQAALPRADTLHALAFECWTSVRGEEPILLTEDASRRVFAKANPALSGHELSAAWQRLGLVRERLEEPGELADAARAYAEAKSALNLADYTDLLVFWRRSLDSGAWANPYTHVLVDEVQDLSALQLGLVRALSGRDGRGFFAIGDPNQSIYSFRGARGNVREYLEASWPGLDVVSLTENYRSSQKVLDLSRPVVPGGPALVARCDVAADLRLFAAPSAAREATWIGERVRELVGGTSHTMVDSASDSPCLAPGDVAILVRMKALIPTLRNTLERMGLPCAVPEAEAFWMDTRVAALLDAVGRTLGIDGPAADAQAERVELPERIVERGPLGIAAYLQDARPFDPLFWQGPEFRKLERAHAEHGGWQGLLNWVGLQSELDQVRAKAEKIQIMTLHAAKGLEFEAVFLPALEDGIVPFAGAGMLTGSANHAAEADEAEERRLFYVGLTRARGRLYLSHAASRTLYGRELRLSASPYLADLDAKLLTRTRVVSHVVRQTRQLGLLGGGE